MSKFLHMIKQAQRIERERRGLPTEKPVERISAPPLPFDPSAWRFYCENCDTHREAEFAAYEGTSGPLMTVPPFCDLICSECKAILLTMEQR